MAKNSKIDWTDDTWIPLAGCSKTSEGCQNCYAEKMTRRLAAMAKAARKRGAKAGRTEKYCHVLNARGHWNGKVRLDYQALYDPLHWKRPKKIFLTSMSDLFHARVPLDFIRRAFDVMASCPQHTFQVLTKRPERVLAHAAKLPWFPNISLGVTVESPSVLHRIKTLKQIPAAIRFLSLEPLLAPIPRLPVRKIDWVIVGGESGPGFRPLDLDWAREIRDRCIQRDVPFFFKQRSGVHPDKLSKRLDGKLWRQFPRAYEARSRGRR